MIFASQLIIFVVFFTKVVLFWTRPVLGGNCFSPNRGTTPPEHESRTSETSTINVGNARTPSFGHQRTRPGHLPPPYTGIMPVAAYLPLFRSRSLPASAPSSSRPVSMSAAITSAKSSNYANRELTPTTPSTSRITRIAPNATQVSLLERRIAASRQLSNTLSGADGSAPLLLPYRRLSQLRQISIPTAGNRVTSVRSRQMHRRRNGNLEVSPKPTTPPLPIIRESDKEETSDDD